MLTVNSVSGQSILDLCAQCYGSLDLLSKFIQDNSVDNVNVLPMSGQSFIWDETLSNNIISKNIKDIYATAVMGNGNMLSIVELQGQSIGTPQPNYYQLPNNTNMKYYEETLETQYIAGGGETLIILPELIGATIVQLNREIQPQRAGTFTLNINTGQITFTSDPLAATETIYIIYTKIVTA